MLASTRLSRSHEYIRVSKDSPSGNCRAVPNSCTSTPFWCSHGWLLTLPRPRPFPSPADRLAAGRDGVLDVVLDILDDRAVDLADGRVTVLAFLGGTTFPSPLRSGFRLGMPQQRDAQTADQPLAPRAAASAASITWAATAATSSGERPRSPARDWVVNPDSWTATASTSHCGG